MRSHVPSSVLVLSLVFSPVSGSATSRDSLPGTRSAQAPSDQPLLEAAAEVQDRFATEKRLFLEGTSAEASRALSKLVAAGPAGVAVAAELVGSLTDRELADQQQARLRGRVQRELGTRIAEGDLGGAQRWFEALVAGAHPDARRELATFLALTGSAKTAHSDPLLEAWRLRALGDPLGARKLLERSGRASEEATDLAFGLAFDLEDWPALAALALQRAAEGGEGQLADVGLAAAAYRAAGDVKRAEECDARLTALVANSSVGPKEAASVLLLNARDDEAMPTLLAAEDVATAFNMLSSEWRYREALELAAKVRAAGDLPAAERMKLEARIARLLAALADSKGAREAVEAHASWSTQDRSPALAAASTIGLELRVGLEDAARERAAAALGALAEDEHPRTLLSALFPQARSEAEVVWVHVSEVHADESPAQLLARCAAYLTVGSADPAGLAALHAIERERAAGFERADRARWYRGLASLAERHGNEKLALDLAEEWNAADERHGARTELAERFAQAGEWNLAAEAWRESFLANPGEPGPLALAGWALTEAGWSGAGEELKLQASLIAAGDGGRRYRLAGLYEKHGLFEDANRERMTLLHTQSPSSWAFGATLRLLAGRAACAGATADAAQWSVPTQLQASLDRKGRSPGLANHWARSLRESHVKQAAEAGDASGAFALADGRLGPWLRDIELTTDVLARLDDEGFVAETERLSWRLLDRLREVSGDFPNSAPHAHAHATLSVGTGRDLDAALVTAGRAVELRPKACTYRSTLAEVLFARGDADEAIASVRETLASCPNSKGCPAFERLQEQQARFGADGHAETTAN